MPLRLTEEQARLVAGLISEAKTTAGLTNRQLADKAGYAERTIRDVLNGRSRNHTTVGNVGSVLKFDLDGALNGAHRGDAAGLVRGFPPPRVASDAQARAVRGALKAFLAHDENRFRRLFLGEQPLVPKQAERSWMQILAAAGYVKTTPAGDVRPCVRVYFLDDLLVATDLLTRDAEDQVFSLMLEQVFLVRSMDVRKGDHVLELCLPGFRVEVRRVDWVSLEACLARFRDRPGYAAWRDRLVSQGATHVWGVHVRALRDGPAGLVRIDAMDDIRGCDATLSRW